MSSFFRESTFSRDDLPIRSLASRRHLFPAKSVLVKDFRSRQEAGSRFVFGQVDRTAAVLETTALLLGCYRISESWEYFYRTIDVAELLKTDRRNDIRLRI